MHKLTTLFFVFFPVLMFSQNIKGKVYDDFSTVKGASIYNATKEQLDYTDDNGDFDIDASINDTLFFYSLFHSQKTLIVHENHFKEVQVIVLKKTVNELDEILLNDTKPKPFNEKKERLILNEEIKKDKEANPHFYSNPPKYGLDFIALAGMIGKLFKKKPVDSAIVPITYKEFDSLFTNDRFFNEKLLTHDLKIPIERKLLFFDYCDAQQIDIKLIHEKNQLQLLDELIKCSTAFLEFQDENQIQTKK